MNSQTLQHNRLTTLSNPVLQLQNEPLPPHAIPKFALTHQKIPFINIICCTEKAAQNEKW